MIRILHVVGGLARGGTESVVMNFYRKIDRSTIQFDFISHHPELCDFEHEIANLGGRVYYVPSFNGINYHSYIGAWHSFFAAHPEYRVIHSHAWSTASIYLPLAKKHGLFTVSHSHSVSARSGLSSIGRKLLKKKIPHCADYYMACSKSAAKWLFGDGILTNPLFTILPNAIDVEKYRFSQVVRFRLREKYGIHNKTVIGHVGTFDNNKNQGFIVKLFASIHSKNDNVVLWLVGDGPRKHEIIDKAHSLGLDDSVSFFGLRDDVADLLQAMDIFLFPSHFESFGNAALEAQAAGLPVICSTGVPEDVIATDLVRFIPLEDVQSWIDAIETIITEDPDRMDMELLLKGSKFDVNISSKWLTNFYLEKQI